MKSNLLVIMTLIVIGAVLRPVMARAGVLVEITRVPPQHLEYAGFTIGTSQSLDIEAVGIRTGGHRRDVRLCQAWVLDAATREVVWELDDADSDTDGDLRIYQDTVTLPKGRYEVYYSTFPDFSEGWQWGKWKWKWGDDNGDEDRRSYNRTWRDFKIVITGEGEALTAEDVERFHEDLTKNAIIAFTRLERDVYETAGFTLQRDMDIDIYAVGEAKEDGDYDTSWIIDAGTRKKVWDFTLRHSDPAGGAKKNRMIKETISLRKGEYALFCATDGSHHFDDWNAAPPRDPLFWGVTLQTSDPKLAQYVKTHEHEPRGFDNVVVEFIKLGDREFESAGFTLKKKVPVRIYAIGEGRDGEMADYSWIIDAETRSLVWEMDYYDTEHAGGARKNRMIDTVIELDKGNYIAYAVTDGSHSYRHWNASAPYDQERWGVTITTTNASDRKQVTEFDEAEDGSVLVRVVGVGDGARERESFELSKRTNIRIYALGEGLHGDMYDYGWIEDGRGKAVWEMTYRMTEHAGGDKKNRVFNNTITLDAGRYTVYYVSDGSHSFRDWNASPPRDVSNWGITIKVSDNS